MEIDLQLTVPCDHFDWIPEINDYDFRKSKDCPKCKGKNEVPTEWGQEILDFVRKHG